MNDPRAARVFCFAGCEYDPGSSEARLVYRIDDGPDLVERIVFPDAPQPQGADARAAFATALRLLHWIAGVSYWKAGLAPEIRIADRLPGEAVRDFLTELYLHGLAEFAYRNGVDLKPRLHFPGDRTARPQSRRVALPERALVAMGGGKDSLVGLDVCRRAGVDVQPWCTGGSPLIGATVWAAGLELLSIERKLAPELQSLNAAGAWNGHVPVTAINAAIGVCAALLYGYRFVVFSNERSADEATLTGAGGMPVNHQYSKSSAFEAAFRRVISEWVSPDVEFFSILRPFSELEIVRRFSVLGHFHRVYSSCNRHFHLSGPAIGGRWCGNCPKCRFAALSLALYLPPAAVRDIVGADLLDDSAQEPGFRALCGLGADKPFECVGETGECRAALQALAQRPGWRDRHIVHRLAPELAGLQVPPLDDLLRASAQHFIPPAIATRIEGLPG